MPETASAPPPRRRPGRPRTADLDERRIVTEALALAAEHGSAALSMRALAVRLGVTPMALYTYVSSRDALIDAMVEEVISRVELPGNGPWREEAARYAVELRRALLDNPVVLELRAQQPVTGVTGLRMIEACLALLRRAGFDRDEAALAYVVLESYTLGAASRRRPGPAGVDQIRELVAALPEAEFPELRAVAGPITSTLIGDHAFLHGLDLLLDALEARLRRGET